MLDNFYVIVAGSRHFSNYNFLKNRLDYLLQNKPNTTIISGTARGADTLGEQYAKEHNLPCEKMPANWRLYGKRAGYVRNIEMAKKADACVVFWDGKSKCTYHMIQIAKQYNLELRIYKFMEKGCNIDLCNE